MEEMVKLTVEGGGESDDFDAACKWLKQDKNYEMIEKAVSVCEEKWIDPTNLICKGEDY